MKSVGVRVISWQDFQVAIAPMWGVADPTTVPIINNPYQVISYPLEQWLSRIALFCYAYEEDGVTVGYTSLYNVDDRTVRTRGVWVLPEHRGRGVGHRMLKHGMELIWSSGFDRLIGFFKESNVERFKRHSQMEEVPGVDWLWSDYSQCRLRVLYRQFEGPVQFGQNRNFIARSLPVHGFGGLANLNREFTEQEWIDFATPHAFQYPDAKIDLNW